VGDEGIRVLDAERDVEQDLAGRDPARPASRSLDVDAYLFVARTTKSLLLGSFSDRPADVGGRVRPSRQALDLVEEPQGDPRREESHGLNRAGQTVTCRSRLRAETVS
jgi:hypothetical protein